MSQKAWNVLVIGQTGAGKSTWLNSIANYFMYETLKDALKENSPAVLIPTTFSVVDKNNQKLEFTFGEPDKNEGIKSSSSKTKAPKVYSFECNGEVVNFIDTPGIGDTGGLEDDDKNGRMILTALTAFPKLHGICILLKSTDSKLSQKEKYCLSEMLTYIHNDALRNIVFVFTHTGISDYEPGDAEEMVNDYLIYLSNKKPNIKLHKNFFCIESEAFKYQCLYSKNPEYNKRKLSIVEESWNHSREKTFELLKYFKNLQPHTVKDTITVNEARAFILVLVPTLGTSSRRNQSDRSYYNLNREEVLKNIRKGEEIPSNKIVNIDLDYPRTVCTSQRCIGYQNDNGTTYYATVCHSRCNLKGIPIASFPEEGLRECAAMNESFTCKNCGCSYALHMHINYEQRIGSNLSIASLIVGAVVGAAYAIGSFFLGKKGDTFVKSREEAETELNEREKQLDAEQEKIIDALSTFATFLKSCAVWPYNEDIESQLQMQIRHEKVIAKETKNNDVVNRLEAIYEKYVEKHEMITKILKNAKAGTVVTSDVILNLKQELFDLPINGAIIKESFEKSFNITSNSGSGSSFKKFFTKLFF